MGYQLTFCDGLYMYHCKLIIYDDICDIVNLLEMMSLRLYFILCELT